MAYVKICEDESLEDVMELPLENDNSLLLSTVTAQFPGAVGIKFKVPESGSMRGVRLLEGRLLPPVEGSWPDHTYICTFPKASKRKAEEMTDVKMEVDVSVNKKKTVDLIVLGLPYSCDEKQMREYFSQFGEVLSCEVKKDHDTAKSRGFGFVHYKDYSGQLEALSRKHYIGGRLCDVKVPDNKNTPEATHRLFVGRLPEWITEEDLTQYFSKNGDIADVYLPRNPFRGFAFLTFVDPSVIPALVKETHVIKNHTIYLQEATPRVSKAKSMERREEGGFFRGGREPYRSAAYEPSGGGQAAQIAAAVAAALAQAGVTPSPQGQGGNYPSQGGGYSDYNSGSSGYSQGYGAGYHGARGDYRGGFGGK